MFSFRVQGFAGSCNSYWSDSPIDVTVFAETEAEAIKKVEAVTGKELSALHRKITTIEAEPVKHGRWNTANDGTHFCSECGCDASYTWDDIDRFFINSADDVPDRISNYCPNCGCKMDLEG